MDLIACKVARIPADKRVRVMRLMGRETIMTPGNDSFQNEMIRVSGGITPDFKKAGSIVPVTCNEWKNFNPQVIYGCGGDRRTAETFFSKKEWKTVEAVKNNRFHSFPCDLTCQAGVNVGIFVSWLVSVLYTDQFGNKDREILRRGIIHTRPVPVALDCVRRATVTTSIIQDFENKSLVIHQFFLKPVLFFLLFGQNGFKLRNAGCFLLSYRQCFFLMMALGFCFPVTNIRIEKLFFQFLQRCLFFILADVGYDSVQRKNEKIVITDETMVCEIQIRTKLQGAWDDITHEFHYKAGTAGIYDAGYEKNFRK